MNKNSVVLIGRVTKKPELKTLPSGGSVVSFSLATNRTWKEKGSNQKKEDTTFHNIVAFGKTADTIAQYVIQGQELFVEGRINNRSWDKPDGTKAYRSEIILESFQFGQKPKNSENATPSVAEMKEKTFDQKVDDLSSVDYPEDEVNLEDIPF